MIDFEYAIAKVREHIEQMDIPVDIIRKEEFSNGWVFVYESRRYVETGDFNERLVGNGPIVIDKDSGEMTFLGTHASVSELLAEYVEGKMGDGR
jgi:hypothetical protein